jgi:hypothetical protein
MESSIDPHKALGYLRGIHSTYIASMEWWIVHVCLAIFRGHRAGLLTAVDYNNMCQCATLDDIKMHLSATEYGPYLQNGAFWYNILPEL